MGTDFRTSHFEGLLTPRRRALSNRLPDDGPGGYLPFGVRFAVHVPVARPLAFNLPFIVSPSTLPE